MASYEETLKQMLEDDLKAKRKPKLKKPCAVTFRMEALEKREKPMKRKHPTPYKAAILENDEFEIHEVNDTTSYPNSSDYSDPFDSKYNTQLIKKKLDFDVHSDSSDNCSENVQSVNDWSQEIDWTVSPSASEFSTSKKKETNWIMSPSATESSASNADSLNVHEEHNLANISVEYNDTPSCDLSHIFDCTSSDSSSDTESYVKLITKDQNYSPISEKEIVEDTNTIDVIPPIDEIPPSQSLISKEEDLYNDIIWEVPGGCIILLSRNSPLYFHGAFAMSVLCGAVDILGYTLTPSCKEVEIYSLRGSSYLFFENKCDKDYECDQSNIEGKLTNLNIENEVVKKIIEKLSPSVAVIFCKVLLSRNLQFLEKYVAQQLLPKPIVHELSCTFLTDPGNWNVLKINNHWEDLAGQLDEYSRVILCGGRGVGKSTLLRFLVNRLLMTHSKVLVIDLDPGQPEFTVSGCISASIVIEPVFGPNYTHQQIPEKCVFVKNINISYDPSEYLNCVVELMNACADLPKNLPTIVNYMGYSRGLGLNLIASVIPLVSPSTVVQIQSVRKQRNFPQKLSDEIIKAYSKLLNLNVNEKPTKHYNLITLESMTDDYEGWQMEPRIVRELGVLSYFSSMLGSNNFCLTSHKVPMYKVNLSNISIVSGENINAAASINASMVALCSLSGEMNVLRCYGWGIVRGIDTECNELYLLTPLSPNDLENVTHLSLGSANLPPAVYMAQDDKHGIVPYVSLGLITNFNSIPKRSHLHKSTYASNNVSG